MTRVHEGMSNPGFTVPDSGASLHRFVANPQTPLPPASANSRFPRATRYTMEYFCQGNRSHDVQQSRARDGMRESPAHYTPFCNNRNGSSADGGAAAAGEEGTTDDSALQCRRYRLIHRGVCCHYPAYDDTGLLETVALGIPPLHGPAMCRQTHGDQSGTWPWDLRQVSPGR